MFQPLYPEPPIINIDSPTSIESDWEMPAAFVKVTEAKRGMEGSEDEAGETKRELVMSDSEEDGDLDRDENAEL